MKLHFLKDSKPHTYAHLSIVYKQLASLYIKLLVDINYLGISGKSINLSRVILCFNRNIICLQSEEISFLRAIHKCVIYCKSSFMGMKSNIWRNIGKVKDVRANFSPLKFRSIISLQWNTKIWRSCLKKEVKCSNIREINRHQCYQ